MGFDQGPKLRGGVLGIPQLDGEQHEIDRGDAGRIVGRIDVVEMEVAVDARDLQSVVADGLEMRATREEHDVVPRGGEPRAEIAADGSRRHDRNPHRRKTPSLSSSRPNTIQTQSLVSINLVNDPRVVVSCRAGTTRGWVMAGISETDVEDNIIQYFADRFQTDPTTILSTTNLKQRFNFSDAAWAGVAEALSALKWMKAKHVRIAQAQMGGNTTVAQLTALIWGKISHH